MQEESFKPNGSSLNPCVCVCERERERERERPVSGGRALPVEPMVVKYVRSASLSSPKL